jgi:hypothetical protein
MDSLTEQGYGQREERRGPLHSAIVRLQVVSCHTTIHQDLYTLTTASQQVQRLPITLPMSRPVHSPALNIPAPA